MTSTYDANLEALRARSPEAADLVDRTTGDPDHAIVRSATGRSVLERHGRALDSRRDPVAAARTQAATCRNGRVLVAGLGTGYLAEALVDHGRAVTAIVVDCPASVIAAMRARDLRRVLETVPVICLESLRDPVALALLRARADSVAAHAPSVTASGELAALVSRWDAIPVADRAPRVVVVGPLSGGSLGIAESVASAVAACGAETRFLEPARFAEAYAAIGQLARRPSTRVVRQGQLVELIGEVMADVVADERPDLLLALAQAPLHRAVLERLRTDGVTTAFWFVENERVLTYWRDLAPAYDHFYGIQPGAFLERLHDAGAARPGYLPLACDPARHVPVALTDEERQRFGADVSFAGAPYLNRRHLFAGLTDLGVRLWGSGWDDAALVACVAEGGERFSTDEMLRIFAASRINLNLHSAAHVRGLDPEPDYVNPRTFELASCGAFQLVDRRAPLPELFDDHEVVAFSSLAELRELIRQYLADPVERRTCAQRARARAHRDHAYVHRLRRVLRETLSPALVAAGLAGVSGDQLETAIGRLEAGPRLTREEALLRIVREVGRSQVAS